MAWYYYLNGGNQGPVELSELQRLHERNVVLPETPVWTEGMAQWEPYQTSTAAVKTPVPAAGSLAIQPCVECGKVFPEDEMLHYENSWVCAACKPIFFQKIKEGVAPQGAFVFASVWKRFVAVFIDGIIIDIFVLVPIVLLAGLGGISHKGISDTTNVVIYVVQYLVPALYEIIFIAHFGATPGKMLMKIKVVTAEGGPISYGLSTGRYFAKMLSAIILGIGYLMAIWDDQKRALHDRICKTRVIIDPS